jgi:hypothetical protein
MVVCGLPISIEQIHKLADIEIFYINGPIRKCGSFEDSQKVSAPQKGFTKFVRLAADLPQMRQFEDLQFADPKFSAICGPNIWQAKKFR